MVCAWFFMFNPLFEPTIIRNYSVDGCSHMPCSWLTILRHVLSACFDLLYVSRYRSLACPDAYVILFDCVLSRLSLEWVLALYCVNECCFVAYARALAVYHVHVRWCTSMCTCAVCVSCTRVLLLFDAHVC